MLSWRRRNEQDGSEDWWWGLIVALRDVHLLQKSPAGRGDSVNKLTKVESVTGWTWRVRCARGVCLFGRCQSLLILIFPFPVSTGPSSPRRADTLIAFIPLSRATHQIFPAVFLRFSVNCFQFVRVLFNVSSVHCSFIYHRCFCF